MMPLRLLKREPVRLLPHPGHSSHCSALLAFYNETPNCTAIFAGGFDAIVADLSSSGNAFKFVVLEGASARDVRYPSDFSLRLRTVFVSSAMLRPVHP
jgi:hypothetical protein